MSQELVTKDQASQPPIPFHQRAALSANVNQGAIAIEQERAIAEARGQMQLARMFPRDLNAAYAEVIDACKLPAMANVAFYTVPQGGQKVTGPSIKLIEQIATSCEHFEWGHRELSRTEATADSFGRSEIEVVAWDKQKNNVSKRQITVLHIMDTKDGPRRLRDQRDIDNRIANVASKQMRGRLQALLPKWLIEAAVEECKKTLAGTNEEPISSRVRKMTQAFVKFGVNDKHLADYLGHPLDDTTIDELIDLTGVFNAVRDGAKPSDFFGNKEAEAEASAATANKLADAAKAGAAAPKRTRREPAATQQQVETQPQDNAQSTQGSPESKPTENQSTSTEAQASNVTNSPEASSSDSSRANAEPEGPLF